MVHGIFFKLTLWHLDDKVYNAIYGSIVQVNVSFSHMLQHDWIPFTANSTAFTSPAIFMSRLEEHRAATHVTNMSLGHNIRFYTNLTLGLLDAMVQGVQLPQKGEVWMKYVAFTSILRAHDAVGIQRALGSSYYAACGLTEEHTLWFKELDTQSATLLQQAFR